MSQTIIGYDRLFNPVTQEAERKTMSIKEVFPYTFDVQSAKNNFVFTTGNSLDALSKLQEVFTWGAKTQIPDPTVKCEIMPGIMAILNGHNTSAYKISQVAFTEDGAMKLGFCMNDSEHRKPEWFLEANLLQRKNFLSSQQDFLLLFREVIPDRPPMHKGFLKLKTAENELVIGDWEQSRDNRVTRVAYSETGVSGITLQTYPATVDLLVSSV